MNYEDKEHNSCTKSDTLFLLVSHGTKLRRIRPARRLVVGIVMAFTTRYW